MLITINALSMIRPNQKLTTQRQQYSVEQVFYRRPKASVSFAFAIIPIFVDLLRYFKVKVINLIYLSSLN
jgi:hypothetical protein